LEAYVRILSYHPGFRKAGIACNQPGELSVVLPQPGRTLSTCGHFLNPALQSISSNEGAGRLSTDEESSMTRHIKPYRYEIQHGDDADFVAYQRKSSDGVWQTISVWMVPQPD
jgi:hypothetical protein